MRDCEPTSSARLSLRWLEVEPALAVTTSRDAAPCAWSGHRGGPLRAWQDGRVIRELPLAEPFEGFDIGAGGLATWDAEHVALRAWPPEGDALAPPRARWRLHDRCVRAICVRPDELELYTVETHGNPYDRTGHRHRTAIGAPIGPALATAWGEAPPFGAEGIQPQPSTEERPLGDGIDGRIVLAGRFREPQTVVATPRGAHAVRFGVEGELPLGAAFARQPDGTLDVLLWNLDELRWHRSDGALLAAVAVPDVQEVAALGDGALVRSHGGLAWLALERGEG